MVEFKIKTTIDQDCTIDATNPDLYDGGGEFLKVGGNLEPKKALLRFNLAEKPTYGDAKIKQANLGIYTSGVTKGHSSKAPQYNIYKMKSNPNGVDWGAGGRIRTVPRGRRIERVVEADNKFYVYGHSLFTGDKVTYTPYVNWYGDVTLGSNICPEVEYYVIKLTSDVLQLASSLQNALAGTALGLSSTVSEPETLGSDISTNPLPIPNKYGLTHYGWLRSEKYSSDIHVVTAYHEGAELLSENFNGSAYRETDLDFEAVNRTVTRRGNPYLGVDDDLESILYDSKDDDHSQNGDNEDLMTWYGNKAGTHIWLKSHKTESDGSGWWRTGSNKKRGRGGIDYVPKHLPKGTKNPNVRYQDEVITGAEPYGDEVTPANSFWNKVRGAAEFQKAPETDTGTNELQATGAVRFSSKKKMTGGQSMNIYQFWKNDSLGVSYPKPNMDADTYERQECMVARNDVPFAPFQMPNHSASGYWLNSSDQTPHTHDGGFTATIDYSTQHPCWHITMNIEKLEKAFCRGISSTTDDLYQSRGITFVWAETPPKKGEMLYEYMVRIGNNDTTPTNNGAFGSATGKNCLGFTLVNTDVGVRLLPLQDATFDTDDLDLKWDDMRNSEYSFSLTSFTSNAADGRTAITEGEWYTYRIMHGNELKFAQLRVEDMDGQSVTEYGLPEFDAKALNLYNCKDSGPDAQSGYFNSKRESGSGQENTSTSGNLTWWGKYFSMWVGNTKTNYSTGTGKGVDWMANEEDRDCETNIFVDSVAYTGVNQTHDNSTLGIKRRDRITISGGRNNPWEPIMGLQDTSKSAAQTANTQARWSKAMRGLKSDTAILLGFEDPSHISSHNAHKKSWRYLYFQDYKSANLSADAPLIWTSDGELPHTKGADATAVSAGAQGGTVGTTKWFSTVQSGYTKRYWSDTSGNNQTASNMEVLDYLTHLMHP